MLRDKWLNKGFVPSVSIVIRGENQNSVPERKKITSIRLLPPSDKTDKTYKTPRPVNFPIPERLQDSVLACGYIMPEWTPQGCRAFLSVLMSDWPDFHVNGWHGCSFPKCWPPMIMDAVTSIYVLSIQDQAEAIV